MRGSGAFGQGTYVITGNGVYTPRLENDDGVEAGPRGGWNAMCITQVRTDGSSSSGSGGYFLRSSKNNALYACAWAKLNSEGTTMQLRFGRGETCYDDSNPVTIQSVRNWVAAEDQSPPVCVQKDTVPLAIRGTDAENKPRGSYAVLQSSSLNLIRDKGLNGDIWCAERYTNGSKPEDFRVDYVTGCVWYKALRDRLMYTDLGAWQRGCLSGNHCRVLSCGFERPVTPTCALTHCLPTVECIALAAADRNCRGVNWTTDTARIRHYARFSYMRKPSASPRPSRAAASASRSRSRKAKKKAL